MAAVTSTPHDPDKTRPRLLDLFCGAGGAAVGYARAGFEIVGVDLKNQPNYPFEFVQADATAYPLDGFNAIHARRVWRNDWRNSPPKGGGLT